jgi:hypothetical protein
MPTPTPSAEANPRHHTEKIRAMLTGLVDHVRGDIEKIAEPRAQALMETTAEVLLGLRKAYEDYERGEERAWRSAA